MPIRNYGVLTGSVTQVHEGTESDPHYQVRLIADTDYRIAINISSALPPSEVEFLVVQNFQHSITTIIEGLPPGFQELPSEPGSGALDYVRGGLFDPSDMQFLPRGVSDLDEIIQDVMQRALQDDSARVHAFGQRFGPEPGKPDEYFGFPTGNGIHDIHMNQGNVGRFIRDDGPWQDGGLLVQFPDQNQWVAIFLKFQSQSWNTDDSTGHTIDS